MYPRSLTPTSTKSYFLFGPRQTGKSTFIQAQLQKKDLYINLLPHAQSLAYSKDLQLFRQEVLAHAQKHKTFTCVIDEVQKVPGLLDDVHDLIENKKIRFILTGSSARKLKQGASNLLAGRAYTYHFFPLTFLELGKDFDLSKALHHGTLPTLWGSSKENASEFLNAYTNTYLREEIQQEGLVRQIGHFSNFLDIAASMDGQLVNYSHFARESGVSLKTIQGYYQILEDTFLAYRLSPWSKSARHRLVDHPKYYFFDPGVTNALTHRLGNRLDNVTRGQRFEQFVIQQLRAIIEYKRKDIQLLFWRTHTGLEVDVLLVQGDRILYALEIKSSDHIHSSMLTGLKAFHEHYPQVPAYVLSMQGKPRKMDWMSIVSWDHFIQEIL